jgi:hypothetical protein
MINAIAASASQSSGPAVIVGMRKSAQVDDAADII